MINMGYVTGSAAQAEPLVVGVDVVYVHTEITKLDETDHEGNPIEVYRYHEVQYGKDEYIKLIAEQNEELNKLMNTVLGVNE